MSDQRATGFSFEFCHDIDAVQRNFNRIETVLGMLARVSVFFRESGSPEGVLVASPTAVCFVRDGGSSSMVYVKVTGVDEFGWEAVQTA